MIPRGIISADGHVCEPANCYTDYIDPKYRDNAPHIERQPDGTDAFIVPGMKRPVALGFIDGAGFEPRARNKRAKQITFKDIREAAYSGKARVPYMDQDGIAAELIYASIGMGLCMHRDAEYKDACMKAYNRWLQAMCSEAPDRIFGLAQTAVLSVDDAIEDFRRAKDMGMVGMMMPGRPIHEDYDHPDYDALWDSATDLDLPICFHILTSREGSLAAPHRGHELNNFLGIIRAVQDVIGLMTLGGVFERHPKLKLVCAEGDAGWMPHYMYRMDHAAKFNFPNGVLKGLSKLPSEYIKSNVWMTFQDDQTAFNAVSQMPYTQLLWASDFPHTDSTWPRSRQLIAAQAAHLKEEERQAIMRDNTAKLFNLPAGNQSWRMTDAAA
ncbi:MAG TPA: amidohydrolase family protein [Candidatus Binataceae bacterium]|nr:amidohydrolase family protein [Candidatus Binataceae bacterium]